jgi:hypothetical protein
MKKLKCKSVNTIHMGKGIPFTFAIFYFFNLCIAWITLYGVILS